MFIYPLVTAGAVLRVAASLRLIDYDMGIDIAGIAWGGAFLLFLIAYAPVLWRPRLGEKRAAIGHRRRRRVPFCRHPRSRDRSA